MVMRPAKRMSRAETKVPRRTEDARWDNWRVLLLGVMTSALGLSAPFIVAFALSAWLGDGGDPQPAATQVQVEAQDNS